MPGALQPRLSWDALWSYANGRGIGSIARLAELTGMDRRSFSRYRSSGEVNELAADRIAVALGDVPESIWGAEYADATAGMIERAQAEQDRMARAKRRRNSRRWRQYVARDPSRIERHNKRRNAAYWANRESELARQRAYDAGRKDARRAYRERVRSGLA